MTSTIRIERDLYEAVQVAAARTGITPDRFVEDALRSRLAASGRVGGTTPRDLPVFSGDGTHPGVDLTGNAALLDVMDAND